MQFSYLIKKTLMQTWTLFHELEKNLFKVVEQVKMIKDIEMEAN